ncbi:MAG: LLM class flavin-dependent oxidoreductase, partial [Alphaproteobacteria bacterium]|nr:LLM class flavin-dependent oxidoreductase [Alphaproteobacteria bacterium]
MRVFTTLPQEDLRKVAPAAWEVEAEGYDGVASMENKHDPFLALAVAGAATERIELHTSVAIAFARTPMAVANVGWDLCRLLRRHLLQCLDQGCLQARVAGV